MVLPGGRAGETARGRHLEGLPRYRCWRQHSAVGTGRPANWVTQQHLGRNALSLLRAENILARDEDGQWQATGRRTPFLVKAPALHSGALHQAGTDQSQCVCGSSFPHQAQRNRGEGLMANKTHRITHTGVN